MCIEDVAPPPLPLVKPSWSESQSRRCVTTNSSSPIADEVLLNHYKAKQKREVEEELPKDAPWLIEHKDVVCRHDATTDNFKLLPWGCGTGIVCVLGIPTRWRTKFRVRRQHLIRFVDGLTKAIVRGCNTLVAFVPDGCGELALSLLIGATYQPKVSYFVLCAEDGHMVADSGYVPVPTLPCRVKIGVELSPLCHEYCPTFQSLFFRSGEAVIEKATMLWPDRQLKLRVLDHSLAFTYDLLHIDIHYFGTEVYDLDNITKRDKATIRSGAAERLRSMPTDDPLLAGQALVRSAANQTHEPVVVGAHHSAGYAPIVGSVLHDVVDMEFEDYVPEGADEEEEGILADTLEEEDIIGRETVLDLVKELHAADKSNSCDKSTKGGDPTPPPTPPLFTLGGSSSSRGLAPSGPPAPTITNDDEMPRDFMITKQGFVRSLIPRFQPFARHRETHGLAIRCSYTYECALQAPPEVQNCSPHLESFQGAASRAVPFGTRAADQRNNRGTFG